MRKTILKAISNLNEVTLCTDRKLKYLGCENQYDVKLIAIHFTLQRIELSLEFSFLSTLMLLKTVSKTGQDKKNLITYINNNIYYNEILILYKNCL